MRATRYVAPLREGGSLPGIVEADDDGLYVCKFRGAGQGPLALVAEVIGGELARSLGLKVPELVRIELDPVLADAEPDPEIQELLQKSAGLNLGVDYLPGALAFDASVAVDPGWAATVVWLDHLITNVDRTARNPNLLCWHGDVWMIDHGAALYRQHGTDDLAAEAGRPFATEHVLARYAGALPAGLEPDLGVVDLVPDEWLVGPPRDAYRAFLRARLDG